MNRNTQNLSNRKGVNGTTVYISVFIIKKTHACISFEIIRRNVYHSVSVIMLWVYERERFSAVPDLESDSGGRELGAGAPLLLSTPEQLLHSVYGRQNGL